MAPGELVDPPRLSGALDAAASGGDGRGDIVAALSAANDEGRARIVSVLGARPFAARAAARSFARLTDLLLGEAWRVVTGRLHPVTVPTGAERLSMLAVGGYGRGEMAPHSDVDLLFLTPWKLPPWGENVIESLLYILWDMGLRVGHASRSVDDCLAQARGDHTIRTALLEHRYLFGDALLADELHSRLWDELFADTAREFVEAKLAERDERHARQGGQRFMLEPNVKEGKGGLRDLQSLFWIEKYVNRVETPGALVERGILTRDEFDRFDRAENFLWAVRCQLHLASGRAMEQLTFDMQIEVAGRLGYRDHGGRRAVEHFMQDYFRHATAVGDLTRIVLTALEARHVKRAPSLIGFLRRRRTRRGYRLVNGRLAIAEPESFFAAPLNILRIFEEALRTGTLLHPDAMRLISARLALIDEALRTDPRAQKLFLGLLLDHGNPERALRRMNELGVLAAFIPEFGAVQAMMQFNFYHRYTVDEHTIQTISVLAQIERGELTEELPIASGILKAGVDRTVLYTALLFHDIGKGREEDHSILGARIARRAARRLGLEAGQTETVVWLVRHHLLMSDTAQKRDIAEPRTVRDFAKAVKTRARLDLLTVLTVCDIRGVGPGIWNNWKAQLLRDLYRQTAEALEGGLEAVNREAREEEARAALRAALPEWSEARIAAEEARHYGPYWQGLPTATHLVFACLLDGIGADEIRMDIHPDPDRDATRVCFALADHPGLFSRLAGALAVVGANVVDARTYTSRDGYATAVFWIQDGEGAPYEEARLPRLRETILKTLRGEIIPREKLADKDRLPRRTRGFRFPTSITFDNEGSDIYTIIEVDTRDRPGLLHDLTRALAEANIYIASAVIATYGAQVVDSFYVKDLFGLKIHGRQKQAGLERRLRAAIEAGAERARA